MKAQDLVDSRSARWFGILEVAVLMAGGIVWLFGWM